MKEETFKIFTGEDIEDFATDLSDYQSKISIWRILFVEKDLFPCQGFGFLIEGEEDIIIYDGLGRRIGEREGCLNDYIKLMGGVGDEDDAGSCYEILCPITEKEFEEIKKIQLSLELKA